MAKLKINSMLAGNFRGAIAGPLLINLVSGVLQPLAWPLILVAGSLCCFWFWAKKPKPRSTPPTTYDAQGNAIHPGSLIKLPGQTHATPPQATQPPESVGIGLNLPGKFRKMMFFSGLSLLLASLITGVLACQRGKSMSQPAVDWIAARFDQLDQGQDEIKQEQARTTERMTEVYGIVQVLVQRSEDDEKTNRPPPGISEDIEDNLEAVLKRYLAALEARGDDPELWVRRADNGDFDIEDLQAFIDKEIQTGQANPLGLYLFRYHLAKKAGNTDPMLTSARVLAAMRPDDGHLQNLYADELFRNKQYDRSIHQSREAVRAYLKVEGSSEISIPYTLDDIGYAYRKTGDNEAAIHAYREAEKAWHDVEDDQDLGLAGTLESIGRLLEIQKKYDEALEVHRRIEDIYRSAYGGNHERVAETLDTIAFVYDMTDQFANSIGAAREAEKIYRDIYGNEHTSVAQMLFEIGMAQYWSKDFPSALESLEEAERIWAKAAPDEKSRSKAIEMIIKIKEELDER